MVEYKVKNPKASFLDKLFNRDTISCMAVIHAKSDNGCYYYPDGSKFIIHKSNLRCNKNTLELTKESMNYLSSVTDRIILIRPGITEEYIPIDGRLELELGSGVSMKFYSDPRNRFAVCDLNLLVDSNMYESPDNIEYSLDGSNYKVHVATNLLLDLCHPFICEGIRVPNNRNEINQMIDSFKILD